MDFARSFGVFIFIIMKKFHMVLPFVMARIENEKGEILLGQQLDLPHKPYPLRWDLPSGKLENFETPEDCIRRELKEETGFDVVRLKFLKISHHYGDDPECTNNLPGLGICYRVEVSGEFAPTEMNDMHWVTPDELKTLRLTPWSAIYLGDLL